MNANNMNVWPVSSTGDTTSNPPSVDDRFSVFGEGVCGEPLIAQHILIDFTPSDKWDNEFVQRKCCAFWRLISRCPELRNLKVLPDPILFEENSETNVDMGPNEWLPEAKKPLETAVSTLASIQGKGLIDNIIMKKDDALCEDNVRNYENSTVTVTHEKKESKTKTLASRNSKKPLEQMLFSSTPSSLDNQLMCDLRDWDKKHSK